jgi:hypothetical protein
MPGRKLPPADLEFLNARMDQLAREIGAMDLDDPRRPALIEEMSELTRRRSDSRPMA